MFYFAYGSNMSSQRLLTRIPSARIVGAGALSGFKMTFRKQSFDGSAKCTIEEDQSSATLGALFQLPADQRYTLDRIEGLGYGYSSADVDVLTQTGEIVTAFTYIGVNLADDLLPYSWYKHHVLTGAKEHGITERYITQIEQVAAIEDPNSDRHQYEMSVYQKNGLSQEQRYDLP